MEPVYSGHPWDTTSWLSYRGGLPTQWNLYIVVTLETQPVGCHTEVVCFIQWNLYIVVTLGTQPVGCYTEVTCSYSGACVYGGHAHQFDSYQHLIFLQHVKKVLPLPNKEPEPVQNLPIAQPVGQDIVVEDLEVPAE